MKFFNKKEDVIDLQLTQYGKYLLSQGKLKPVYYAFFDDDILYDGNYAGVTEEQNAIKARIEETVRTKTQYVFDGIETTINHNNKLIRGEVAGQIKDIDLLSDEVQPTTTRNYALSLPIGNSSYNTEKLPAWSVSFLEGHISSSYDHIGHPTSSLYGQNFHTMKIPQIETKVQYDTIVTDELSSQLFLSHDDASDLLEDYPDQELPFSDEVFDNGTSYKITEDYIIIEFKEENAPFLNYNFDIEVFEMTSSIDPAGNEKEILLPLSFIKPVQSNIVNNILIDAPPMALSELDFQNQIPITNPTYVEHFFNIHVDKEIDPETMCKLINVKKDINTKLLDTYECPDKKTEFTQTPIDVYATLGGVKEDEIEDC